MAFNFNYTPTGLGEVSVEAFRRMEEEKNREKAIAFMLQTLGAKNQYSLGLQSNQISAAAQKANALNAVEAQKLAQQRQDHAEGISERQMGISDAQLQLSQNAEYNQIQQNNMDRRAAQGVISGGNFGLSPNYSASLGQRDNRGFGFYGATGNPSYQYT